MFKVNRILLFFFIFSIVFTLGFAQEVKGKENATPTGHAKLVLDKTTYDFGDIKPNSKVTCRFNIKNEGTAALQIQKVQTSCGCTAAVPEKRVLAPGEKSYFDVTYHSGYYAGKVKKVVHIFTNDPDRPSREVYITANIVTDLKYYPNFVRFTNINKDKPSTVDVFFKPQDMKKFKILDIQNNSPFIETKLENLKDGRLCLHIKYNPRGLQELAGEYVSTRIKLLTNSNSFPNINLPVYIRFKKHYEAIPERLFIYNVKKGESVTRTLLIKNNKGIPFKITKVVSSNPHLKASIENNGEVINAIKLVLDSNIQSGFFSCNVVVYPDNGKPVIVHVRARINNREKSFSNKAYPLKKEPSRK